MKASSEDMFWAAISNRCMTTLELAIKKGADPTALTRKKRSALYELSGPVTVYSTSSNAPLLKIAEKLMELGCNPLRDGSLVRSIQSGSAAIRNILIGGCVKYGFTDCDGDQIIFVLCEKMIRQGGVFVIASLSRALRYGADPNLKSGSGRTCLEALWSENSQLSLALSSVKNKDSFTLTLSASDLWTSTEILIKAGTDLSSISASGAPLCDYIIRRMDELGVGGMPHTCEDFIRASQVHVALDDSVLPATPSIKSRL
jgi:hypothetical protein